MVKKGDEWDEEEDGCDRRMTTEVAGENVSKKDMILRLCGEDDKIRTGELRSHELRKAVAALMGRVTISCDRHLVSIEIYY